MALVEIRDRLARDFQSGGGYSEEFSEVASINHHLQNDDATYALFKDLDGRNPQLARQCYFYAESLLVSKGEYELCLNYMGDPQFRYDLIRQGLDMERGIFIRTLPGRPVRVTPNGGTTSAPVVVPIPPRPADTSDIMKKSANDRFVGQVCQLIEILVATSHKVDAEKIRDQAAAVLDDARLKSAITDAEKKVQQNPAAKAAADLREAKAKLAELRAEYTDQHPLVQKQMGRIKALEGK